MEVKKIGINAINPAGYNPRRELKPGDEEYESLKESINSFGYVEPIIINKTGVIIGGHQRYKVLRDLGYAEIDCVVLDMPIEREKALNIALNKIEGGWDQVKLDALLQELDGSDLFALTGFTAQERKILNYHAQKAASSDDDGSAQADGGTEISLGEFGDAAFEHKCPRCGFAFNG